jgi:hypothetical protein
MVDLDRLHSFILEAKASTYIGGGEPAPSCRPHSSDLAFERGKYSYLDSYFGGSDFIGEEVVYFDEMPIWAMNYYGRILHPDKITAAETGAMIKASLSRMYAEGRFLGGWEHQQGNLAYHDTSEGSFTHFTGREWIVKDGIKVYELIYHGGLIK